MGALAFPECPRGHFFPSLPFLYPESLGVLDDSEFHCVFSVQMCFSEYKCVFSILDGFLCSSVEEVVFFLNYRCVCCFLDGFLF